MRWLASAPRKRFERARLSCRRAPIWRASGCYEVDFAERRCFIDDRFHDICGVPAGRHPGLLPVQFWMEHVHPDDRQLVLEERDKLHDGKVDRISIEYRYLHPTQGQRWLHHSARVAAREHTGTDSPLLWRGSRYHAAKAG